VVQPKVKVPFLGSRESLVLVTTGFDWLFCSRSGIGSSELHVDLSPVVAVSCKSILGRESWSREISPAFLLLRERLVTCTSALAGRHVLLSTVSLCTG
jgi:hypothetical protein